MKSVSISIPNKKSPAADQSSGLVRTPRHHHHHPSDGAAAISSSSYPAAASTNNNSAASPPQSNRRTTTAAPTTTHSALRRSTTAATTSSSGNAPQLLTTAAPLRISPESTTTAAGGGDAHVRAIAGSTPPPVGYVEDVDALMQELSVLRDENAKLRVIHDQFWIVLDEREGFQKEVEQLRQSLPQQHGANSSSGSRPYGSSSSVGGGEGGSGAASSSLLPSSSSGPSAEQWQAMRTQYDSMSNALQECFDVLLSKELKTTLQKTEIGSRGSVQAFLAWLNLTHDRATALHALVSSRDSVMMGAATSLSPSRRPALNVYTPQLALGSISKEEKEHLLRELHDAKQEIKQLQEELDRTDVSRLQALDDSQRMHQQVQILSEGVRELRGAYQQVKGQAETSAKHAQLVAKLQEETKQKDTVIQELRHRVSQLQRFSAVGDLSPAPLPQQQQQQAVGTSNPHHKALAADAARIRQQMNERKRSESMERLEEEVGPTSSTRATAKRRSPSNEQNIVLSP